MNIFFMKETQLDKLSCLLSKRKDNLIALMTNRTYNNDEPIQLKFTYIKCKFNIKKFNIILYNILYDILY